MGFGDDNASAVSALTQATQARDNFLLSLMQQRLQAPQMQASTALAQAQADAANAENRRQQEQFDFGTLPGLILQLRAKQALYNKSFNKDNPDTGATPTQDQSASQGGAQGAPASPDGSPGLGQGAGSSGMVLPPVAVGPRVGTPGASIASPTTGKATPPLSAPVQNALVYGPDGQLKVADWSHLTPDEIDFYNQHPDKVASLRPELQSQVQTQLSAIGQSESNVGKNLQNQIDAVSARFGTPEERKEHKELSMNAAALSHRLDQYHDVVSQYGNWANSMPVIGTGEPKATALLDSLPLDIADNWTKVTNPGGVLREGLVNLGQEHQIPSGLFVRSGTTLAAIEQTRKVLADYIRQYENLPTTKAPVIGLTPQVRAMVGETDASKKYELDTKQKVPTDEGDFSGKSTKADNAKPAPSAIARVGDSVSPGTTQGNESPLGSDDPKDAPYVAPSDLSRVPAGRYYKDDKGNVYRRSGGAARTTPSLGSTGGAPRGNSLPAVSVSPNIQLGPLAR